MTRRTILKILSFLPWLRSLWENPPELAVTEKEKRWNKMAQEHGVLKRFESVDLKGIWVRAVRQADGSFFGMTLKELP